MGILVGFPLTLLADAMAASNAMRSFVAPIVTTLCVIATLACAFFLVAGGTEYMASRGKPENLEHAKRTLKNALIGLVLIIGAATLTAILSHAYGGGAGTMADKLPTLTPIQQDTSTSFWDVVIKAIIHVLQNIVDSIGQPFVQALGYFTNATPLMGDNSNVFNMWLAIVGITDALFVLVIALLGFQVMSFSTLGFDELDIRQLLPQIALVFLLVNTSIFAIDGVIAFSNGMIHALQSGFPCTSVWDLLSQIIQKSTGLGLGGLLILVAFLVLTVMLLVYYVGRLITLYIGAVLSPLVMLLYLLPAFKDFAVTALKIYLTTIFVLFVQVVIMQLASSIFGGILQGDNSGQPNILMALIVGLATVWALLKTQGVMKELAHAATGPHAAREMARSFRTGVSYLGKSERRAEKIEEDIKRRLRLVQQRAASKVSNARSNHTKKTSATHHASRQLGKPLRANETRRSAVKTSPYTDDFEPPKQPSPVIEEKKK